MLSPATGEANMAERPNYRTCKDCGSSRSVYPGDLEGPFPLRVRLTDYEEALREITTAASCFVVCSGLGKADAEACRVNLQRKIAAARAALAAQHPEGGE